MSNKLEARVRTLQKLTHNKHCFDCLKTGLQSSVVFPFGIFVCTNCSGLHRQFPSHSVATISMANFNERQVKMLEDNGNEVARNIWLATWSNAKFPRESSRMTSDRLSEFIRLCFERKEWQAREGSQPQPQSLAAPTGQSRLTVNPNLHQDHAANLQTPMSTSSLRRPTQSYQPQSTRANVGAQPAPAPTPSANHQQVDLFDTSIAPTSQPNQQQNRPSSSASPAVGVGLVQKPTSYANVIFPGAVQPSTLSPASQDAMKAISKIMASVIVQHGLSAAEFFEVCETAGQVTAHSWAQREAKNANTTASPSVNLAALPPASTPHPQQQFAQPIASPHPQTGTSSTLNPMFNNLSLDTPATMPVQQNKPVQQQPDMFAAAAMATPVSQPPQQQQPAFGGAWDFSQPSPRAGGQPPSSAKAAGDDIFGDLVKPDAARPPTGGNQPGGWQQQQQQQPQYQHQPQQQMMMMGGQQQQFYPQQQQQPQSNMAPAQPYWGTVSPQQYQQQQMMPLPQQPMNMNMGMGMGMGGFPQQQQQGHYGGYPGQQQPQQQQQQQPPEPTFDDIDLPF